MEPCSVEQAAIYALREFLQVQFDGDTRFGRQPLDTSVLVRGEWPSSGDNLTPQAISILPAGERRETHLTEEVVKVTDKPNGQGEYTWSVKAFTQPIQLDIWATFDSRRNLMQAALDRFLNMGTLYTLSAALRAANSLSGTITRDGVLLALDPASGNEGFVDFTFEGPRVINDEASTREYQFRSIIRGEVDGELTFTATTAKLARIKLQQTLDRSAANFILQKNAAGTAMHIASGQL